MTPGESTREFYRKQGAQQERRRIIEALEGFDWARVWEQVAWSPDAYKGFDADDIIPLINADCDRKHSALDNCNCGQRVNRIKANIMRRVTELEGCHKNDKCAEFASLIESYIPEWLEETK